MSYLPHSQWPSVTCRVLCDLLHTQDTAVRYTTPLSNCSFCSSCRDIRDHANSGAVLIRYPRNCDSPTPLHFSVGGMVPVSPFRKGYWFIGETDLLVVACYDLFTYLDRNTCMTGKGQGHHGRQVSSFRRCEFCVKNYSRYRLSSERYNCTLN
jgi:hypothetical protein